MVAPRSVPAASAAADRKDNKGITTTTKGTPSVENNNLISSSSNSKKTRAAGVTITPLTNGDREPRVMNSGNGQSTPSAVHKPKKTNRPCAMRINGRVISIDSEQNSPSSMEVGRSASQSDNNNSNVFNFSDSEPAEPTDNRLFYSRVKLSKFNNQSLEQEQSDPDADPDPDDLVERMKEAAAYAMMAEQQEQANSCDSSETEIYEAYEHENGQSFQIEDVVAPDMPDLSKNEMFQLQDENIRSRRSATKKSKSKVVPPTSNGTGEVRYIQTPFGAIKVDEEGKGSVAPEPPPGTISLAQTQTQQQNHYYDDFGDDDEDENGEDSYTNPYLHMAPKCTAKAEMEALLDRKNPKPSTSKTLRREMGKLWRAIARREKTNKFWGGVRGGGGSRRSSSQTDLTQTPNQALPTVTVETELNNFKSKENQSATIGGQGQTTPRQKRKLEKNDDTDPQQQQQQVITIICPPSPSAVNVTEVECQPDNKKVKLTTKGNGRGRGRPRLVQNSPQPPPTTPAAQCTTTTIEFSTPLPTPTRPTTTILGNVTEVSQSQINQADNFLNSEMGIEVEQTPKNPKQRGGQKRQFFGNKYTKRNLQNKNKTDNELISGKDSEESAQTNPSVESSSIVTDKGKGKEEEQVADSIQQQKESHVVVVHVPEIAAETPDVTNHNDSSSNCSNIESTIRAGKTVAAPTQNGIEKETPILKTKEPTEEKVTNGNREDSHFKGNQLNASSRTPPTSADSKLGKGVVNEENIGEASKPAKCEPSPIKSTTEKQEANFTEISSKNEADAPALDIGSTELNSRLPNNPDEQLLNNSSAPTQTNSELLTKGNHNQQFLLKNLEIQLSKTDIPTLLAAAVSSSSLPAPDAELPLRAPSPPHLRRQPSRSESSNTSNISNSNNCCSSEGGALKIEMPPTIEENPPVVDVDRSPALCQSEVRITLTRLEDEQKQKQRVLISRNNNNQNNSKSEADPPPPTPTTTTTTLNSKNPDQSNTAAESPSSSNTSSLSSTSPTDTPAGPGPGCRRSGRPKKPTKQEESWIW